jgi:hypothetical protein
MRALTASWYLGETANSGPATKSRTAHIDAFFLVIGSMGKSRHASGAIPARRIFLKRKIRAPGDGN